MMRRARTVNGGLLIGILVLLGEANAVPPQTSNQPPPHKQADKTGDQAVDLVKRAQTLNRERKQDEALVLYRRALELNPALFDAHLGAGFALDLKGDYVAARHHLGKAVEVASADTIEQALSGLAVSYIFEGKVAEAAPHYQKVFDRRMSAQNFTAAAGTANALGRSYLESGDLKIALTWYRTGYETAKRQPNLPGEDLDLWEMRWTHAQWRIATRAGQIPQARAHASQLKALVDKGGKNAEQLPIYQYLVGYIDLYAGNYDAALAELLKGDLQDPFVLALIAQAYEKKGDEVNTREYYRRVMQSNDHSLQVAFARPLARKRLAN